MTNTNHPARPPVRLPTIDALSDPDVLAAVVGPVVSIERSPLVTLGYTYTGNTLERLDLHLASGGRRTLVLKRTATTLNWVERRSGDAVGREAALLAEPALTGVWEVLECPYRAFASHGGEAGLLMDDLSDHLLPDIDEPIAVADEDALLSALAALHARYWESDVLQLPWLAAPAIRFALLGPMASTEETRLPEPDAFFDDVRRGWEMAFFRRRCCTVTPRSPTSPCCRADGSSHSTGSCSAKALPHWTSAGIWLSTLAVSPGPRSTSSRAIATSSNPT